MIEARATATAAPIQADALCGAMNGEAATDILFKVEAEIDRDPYINIYHACRKAGVTTAQYKAARGHHWAS